MMVHVWLAFLLFGVQGWVVSSFRGIGMSNIQRTPAVAVNVRSRHNIHLRPLVSLSCAVAQNVDESESSLPKAASINHPSIRQQLMQGMKDAMKTKAKTKLDAIRAIQSAIKQKEIDERIEVTDDMIVTLMSKMIKQRKESIQTFVAGGRQDLAETEKEECDVIQMYLPAQMSEEDILAVVSASIAKLSANSVKDIGKVMTDIRPTLMGKADMSLVGSILKKQLSGK